MQAIEAIDHGRQIGFPDVAAVDHAHRQHLGRGQPVDHLRQLIAPSHAIDMHAGHRQFHGDQQVFTQGAEVAGEQQLDARAVQCVIGALERGAPLDRQIEREDRLVNLHPFHPLRFQPQQNLRVDRQQAVQQVEPVEVGGFFLAQPEETERTDQYGLGVKSGHLRFANFVEQPVFVQRKPRIRLELGHQVVIVGIEPLGHFHGVAIGIAARQLEILRQVDMFAEAETRLRRFRRARTLPAQTSVRGSGRCAERPVRVPVPCVCSQMNVGRHDAGTGNMKQTNLSHHKHEQRSY